MNRPIVNLEELSFLPLPDAFAPQGDAATRYAPRLAMIGAHLGTRKLGCNVIALAPGKRAFPFHSHRSNEELFIVLSGHGEIRIGAARHSIRAGDIVSCVAGGPETAHQIINSGSVELRYLAISTKYSPDIAEFPDSNKYSVIVDETADDDGVRHGLRTVEYHGSAVGYWDGE